MKFISHRGNLTGPNPNLENRPDYVDKAIAAGFTVEVDVRLIGNQFFLGHDYPAWAVDFGWINQRKESLLLHLKDVNALHAFASRSDLHYFCHVNDPYTFTSQGRVWIHDLSLMPNATSIVPLMTRELVRSYPNKKWIDAICSDYEITHEGDLKHTDEAK